MKKRPFPRLSRGGKILRNLLLTLMLAVFLWGLNDFRVPGLRRQFRMVEQANWADPLDIQGEFESEYDRWILASGRDQLAFWTEDRSGLVYWTRAAEGPTLAPVPESRSVQEAVQVAAADVPEGTASARLELTVGCWYKRNGTNGWTFDSRAEQPGDMPPLTQRWEKTYSAQGQHLEDGAFLFEVAAEEEWWESGSPEKLVLSYADEWDLYWSGTDRRAVDCAMEAVFYDEAGRELGRASLSTPE